MNNGKSAKIRQVAEWLKSTSVCSNGDSSTPITKRDLEKFRNNVAKAISVLADLFDE